MSAAHEPTVTVLVPVYRPEILHLRQAVDSVLRQTHPLWQLVLVDDGSHDPQLTEYLAALRRDPRIITGSLPGNMGISHASNRALALAEGGFVALLDQDDMLEEHALAMVAAAIRAHDGVDLIYTDRVTITRRGRPVEVFRKPDWSPERLRQNMYVAHLTVLRRERVLEVGGFDPQLDGAQDHDLVLRVTELGGGVVHIPEVLYRWRQSRGSTASNPANKPHAASAGLEAVTRHVRRSGVRAIATQSEFPGVYRLERRPHAQPLTILVEGSLDRQGSLAWLDQAEGELGRVNVIEDVGGAAGVSLPGHLGRRVADLAAEVPDGVVLILDPGMQASWPALRQLIAAAQAPDVGVAGARLVTPSGRLAAAGLAARGGRLVLLAGGIRGNAPGPFAANLLDREVSAVILEGCAMRTRSLRLLAELPEATDACVAGLLLGNALWARGQRVLQVNTAEIISYAAVPEPSRVPTEWLRPAVNVRGIDRFSDPTPPRTYASRISHRLRSPGPKPPRGTTSGPSTDV